jgi:hypothetical protein
VTTDAIYLVTIWALPVIIAITFHEAAHGFVTHLLGDDTAWRLGRVSFNPLKHIDPFGTILLPALLLLLRSPFVFGYAKRCRLTFVLCASHVFPSGRYDDQVDALLLFLDWFAANEDALATLQRLKLLDIAVASRFQKLIITKAQPGNATRLREQSD